MGRKKILFRYYDEMEAMENEIMESGQKVYMYI